MALFLIESTRGSLAVQCTAGPEGWRSEGVSIAVGDRVSGWVAANRRAMVNAEARLDIEDPGSLRWALALPLIADGQLAAVLTLYAAERFSDEDVRRLEGLVAHLAGPLLAVERERDRLRSSSTELRVVARR